MTMRFLFIAMLAGILPACAGARSGTKSPGGSFAKERPVTVASS